MRNEYAEEIKNQISMRAVCDRYGIQINRMGYTACPFHTEKTPSLKIYKKDYHCFGCGAHGSVIDFVMQLYGIDFAAAITRLNIDFQLGLQIGRPMSRQERNAFREAERARQRKEEEHKKEVDRINAEYEKLLAMWQILDSAKTRFAPEDPEKCLNVFFVDALQYKEYLEYLIDEKGEERRRICGR